MRTTLPLLFILGTIAFPLPASAQSAPPAADTRIYNDGAEVLPPLVANKAVAANLPADKALAASLAAIASASTSASASSSDYGLGGSDATHCDKCWHLLFFADLTYWNVHGSAVPFAQPFDGVGPLAAPKGPVAVANPGFDSGFRIGGGLGWGNRAWVVGTFTYLQNNTDATAAAPPGDVLHGNLVFPNTVVAGFVPLEADAHYVLRLYSADLDYKCAIVYTDHVVLNWLAGARYAHLDQNLTANYSIFGVTTVASNISFDGGGPRFGLEGEYHLFCGLFGYAKGMANFLAGHFDSTYTQRNTFAGQQATTSLAEDRLVPILELELGVGWQSCKGRVRVMAGYYVGSWFNTLTVPSMVQGVQNNNFTTNGDNFRDTLTFDGLFARVEFRY